MYCSNNCETHTNFVQYSIFVVSVYTTKYEFVESKYRKHLYYKAPFTSINLEQ